MNAFLKHVAEDLYKKYGNRLADTAIVFPNKRAGLFFNEYLKQMSAEPLWSPAYMTINELFAECSDLVEGDIILLVSKLYKVFCKHTRSSEPLDRFYYWGEMLIKDFDDIDKNLVDAEKLFVNLKELREMGNAADILDDEQKKAIQQFFANFNSDEKNEIKRRFLDVWRVLLPIYSDFRESLRSDGIAYSGMMCREVIESNKELLFPFDKYIFVGFNALNRSEAAMFRILQQQEKALFYWDYDVVYTNDKHHEAGRFMRENLEKYPNAMQSDVYDNLGKKKNITFISAATENIQTRYLADWLSSNVDSNEIENAVVLCDESLLGEVLHTVPPTVRDINVTMGYPVSHTPVYSFLQRLIELQIKGYDETRKKFRYEAVHAMLKHPYTLQCSENARAIDEDITKKRNLFPSTDILHADEFLAKVFVPATDNLAWIDNLRNIIYTITNSSVPTEENEDAYTELFRESLFSVYTQAQRMMSLLETGDLQLQLRTFASLFMRVVGSLALPFHGEPVVGLQIMGLLETRNLDFKNLILLSANEGNLPRNNSENSFIPYTLRRAFGLMLTEHRNSVYAYNFYRLIQRAENITMLYNSSSDGAGQGERSRYMMQLLASRAADIKEMALTAEQKPDVYNCGAVEKNGEILKQLRAIFDKDKSSRPLVLSPSGINRYLDCPMKFYYYYLAKLKVNQEVESTIQAVDFGNIFHRAAELFYEHITADTGTTIQKSHLEPYIKKSALLYTFVEQAFNECFFMGKSSGKLDYDGEQIINFEVVHRFLLRLVKMDSEYAPFTYVGSEQDANFRMETKTSDGETVSLCIGGRVDRMDCKNDTIQIVDYKTGGKPDAPNDVSALFSRTGKRSGYIFQAMLYSAAVSMAQKGKKVSPSLLYIHKQSQARRENYVINIGKQPVVDYSLYHDEFIKHLQNTIDEIFDANTPFYCTTEKDRCTYCDYKNLCGER